MSNTEQGDVYRWTKIKKARMRPVVQVKLNKFDLATLRLENRCPLLGQA